MNPESVYVDDFRACDSTYASLDLHHPDQHPDRVTEILGLEPTDLHAIGADSFLLSGVWRTPRKDRPRRVRRFHYWGLSSDGQVQSRDLLRHIDWILGRFDGKDAAFRRLLELGWDAEISVFWLSKFGGGGPTLTPATLGRMGELNLTLWIDFYDSDPNEQEPHES